MRTVLQRILRATALCAGIAATSSAWAAGETVTVVTPLATGSASDVALRIVVKPLDPHRIERRDALVYLCPPALNMTRPTFVVFSHLVPAFNNSLT